MVGTSSPFPRCFENLRFLFTFWRIPYWKISPRGNSGESSKRRKWTKLLPEPEKLGQLCADGCRLSVFCQGTKGLACFSSQDLEMQRMP